VVRHRTVDTLTRLLRSGASTEAMHAPSKEIFSCWTRSDPGAAHDAPSGRVRQIRDDRVPAAREESGAQGA
jgi:hypothetical protein